MSEPYQTAVMGTWHEAQAQTHEATKATSAIAAWVPSALVFLVCVQYRTTGADEDW